MNKKAFMLVTQKGDIILQGIFDSDNFFIFPPAVLLHDNAFVLDDTVNPGTVDGIPAKVYRQVWTYRIK